MLDPTPANLIQLTFKLVVEMEVLFFSKMGLYKLKRNRRWSAVFMEGICQAIIERPVGAEEPGGLSIKDC